MFPSLTRDDVFRIETPRLWLRWPRLDDAPMIARWVRLREGAALSDSFHVDMTIADIAARLQRDREANEAGRALNFVLVPQGRDGEVIGRVDVGMQPGGRLELGYHLDPVSWGRGLMTEAVTALTEQTFDLMPIANISAHVRPENATSIRVLKKCGFKLTGSGEHDSPVTGRYFVHTYALTRSRPSALLAAKHRHSSRRSAQHALVGLV